MRRTIAMTGSLIRSTLTPNLDVKHWERPLLALLLLLVATASVCVLLPPAMSFGAVAPGHPCAPATAPLGDCPHLSASAALQQAPIWPHELVAVVVRTTAPSVETSFDRLAQAAPPAAPAPAARLKPLRL